MSPPFTQSAYENRQHRVQTVMAERKLDALVIGDPANMNWLTGIDRNSITGYCSRHITSEIRCPYVKIICISVF